MITVDLVEYLREQKKFSLSTFGPGDRTVGVIDHIKKELKEIEEDPHDLTEWIDVVTLALDGAWRAGHRPEAIAAQLVGTLQRNINRKWPDWRTVDTNKSIEHIRG